MGSGFKFGIFAYLCISSLMGFHDAVLTVAVAANSFPRRVARRQQQQLSMGAIYHSKWDQ
jgi:hypothetical protein